MKDIKYLTKYIIIGSLIILLLFIIFYDFFKIKEGFGLKDIGKIVGDIKNITNVVGDIPNEIKIKAKAYLDSIVSRNLKLSYFKYFLRSYISCYISYEPFNENVINQYYEYLQQRKKFLSIFILKFLYNSKFIRFALSLCLSFISLEEKKSEATVIYYGLFAGSKVQG